MERGPSYEPSSAINEYYRRLFEIATQEVERSPELRRELTGFVNYIGLLQQAAPLLTELPYPQRTQAVHWEVEREAFPSLPIILPPPHKKVSVGEHMDVTVGMPASVCWPDDAQNFLVLSDGTEVTRAMPVGKIDIVRDFERLSEDTNMMQFMRKLMKSSVQSLKELATLCQRADSRLTGVEVFAGVSHLARIAGKFEFSTFAITNVQRRSYATEVSRSVAEHVSGGNRAWNEIKQNYKPAQVAFISREKLVQTFGE